MPWLHGTLFWLLEAGRLDEVDLTLALTAAVENSLGPVLPVPEELFGQSVVETLVGYYRSKLTESSASRRALLEDDAMRSLAGEAAYFLVVRMELEDDEGGAVRERIRSLIAQGCACWGVRHAAAAALMDLLAAERAVQDRGLDESCLMGDDLGEPC